MRRIFPALLALLTLLPFTGARAAVRLEFLTEAEIASDFRFGKTRVGGLSGLVKNPVTGTWFAVSDDRGRIDEPRFYEIDLNLTKEKSGWNLKVDWKKVHFIRKKGEKRWKGEILDPEGITVLPWGNFLISSEGDNNRRPRNEPVLLDVKADGTWARNFALPDECLPERSGEQTKGILNNKGPEGLAASEDGRSIFVALEGPLMQDREKRPRQARLIEYGMPEAWVIRPKSTFFYPVEPFSADALVGENGVVEVLSLGDRDLLVLERALEASAKGLRFEVKLFQVRLGEPDSLLKKEPVLDLKTVREKLTNFEAMAWGPELPDGRKTLVVLSDNNFQKGEATRFWVFAVGTEK